MRIERLDKLFHPSSIAVVGASDRKGSIGRAVMQNLIEAGFEGTLLPVNHHHASIMGYNAVAELGFIESPVDLAVIATPMQTVPGIIDTCARIGVASAVIISAGGKETGEIGRQMENKIQKAAAGSGLRIVGPNCLGVMCSSANLNASFAARMPLDGKMAFVSQSGAICTAVLDFSAKEHIGYSHFISLGSMLDVDFGDMIDYLGTDPSVTSIVMYVESLNRQRTFMSAARAVSRVKPIIALKAGRTCAGAKAASSHTGAMAGEDAVYDAAFQRAGIVRVKTFEELFDTAEILSRKGRYQGQGLAIVTNAGGPGVMATDALADHGVKPVTLSAQTLEALNKVLPGHWSHGNPVDIIGDATPERYSDTISILLQAKEVDALLIMLAPQAMTDAGAVAHMLAEKFGDTSLPVLTSWLGGVDVEQGREILNCAGFPTFDTPERAIRAFMNLQRHSHGIEMLQQIPPRLSSRIEVDQNMAEGGIQSGLSLPGGMLSEIQAKSILGAYGIPVNPTMAATSTKDALSVAGKMGYPVAMKILSPDIAHKSDANGVLLNLKTPQAVEDGYNTLLENARRYSPAANIDGVTLQPMVDPITCELIVGAKSDRDFGPVILFGMGGVFAELFQDRAIALPPLNRLLASRLMEGTRIDQLLKGFRNIPPANREELEAVLIRLAQLVTDFPQIRELDINPMVIQKGHPLSVDARMVVKPAPCLSPMHLVVSPYPTQYEARVNLPEVGDLLIRPIRPEDAPLLVELFHTLSPQSVYYRFFSPMHALSHKMLARFTQIDYDREIALVAITGSNASEKMLGAARVILQHNLKDAEFAVLVGDPWQGKGIGAHLLATCLAIAKERQFGLIWGTVLAENKGMRALGRKLGFSCKRGESAGEFSLTLDLRQLPRAPSAAV